MEINGREVKLVQLSDDESVVWKVGDKKMRLEKANKIAYLKVSDSEVARGTVEEICRNYNAGVDVNGRLSDGLTDDEALEMVVAKLRKQGNPARVIDSVEYQRFIKGDRV